jgi:uncharacterized protein DUF2760
LQRFIFAIRAFFAILFTGKLPPDIARAYGFVLSKPQPAQKAASKTAPAKEVPQLKPSDGALQMLSILQRDSRLIDFVMEDISAYSDDQVGAAVRSLHDQCRDTLDRYVHLSPVIDGVEGTFTKLDTNDPNKVKLLGNVPASGKAPGGLLRHKGWRVERIELPQLAASQNATIIAPAEIEVE